MNIHESLKEHAHYWHRSGYFSGYSAGWWRGAIFGAGVCALGMAVVVLLRWHS